MGQMNNISKIENSHHLIYLLGAGASYPAIPLASGVSAGMIKWGAKLKGKALPVYQDTDEKDSILEMADELTKWGNEASQHFSTDTLAKKLFLTNQNRELINLKAAMSAFFMLEQSLNKAEQRYDSFFAAILENPGNPPILPESIGILTWNYDRQLEKAYHQYCPNIDQVQENITFSKHIFRINGLLGRAMNKGTGPDFGLDFKKDELSVYKYIIREYLQLKDNDPDMSFAFENKKDYRINDIKALVENAKTLVIVGYSFPFFNRIYDKEILNAIGNLEKIYLQVLPKDFEAVKTRILTLRELPEIEPVDDQSQFYVPHDF